MSYCKQSDPLCCRQPLAAWDLLAAILQRGWQRQHVACVSFQSLAARKCHYPRAEMAS